MTKIIYICFTKTWLTFLNQFSKLKMSRTRIPTSKTCGGYEKNIFFINNLRKLCVWTE
jgi:hypothetical protein